MTGRNNIVLIVVIFALCGCDQKEAEKPLARKQTPPVIASEKKVGGILLKPATELDGALSFLFPDGFKAMDKQMLVNKYPSERRPAVAYTNGEGTVNIAIQYTDSSVTAAQMEDVKEQMELVMRKQFPKATWFFNDFKVINNREWLYIDLQTPAQDTDIRNMMVATSYNRRMLLITFNVTKELEDQWLEPGKAIIESVSILF